MLVFLPFNISSIINTNNLFTQPNNMGMYSYNSI